MKQNKLKYNTGQIRAKQSYIELQSNKAGSLNV